MALSQEERDDLLALLNEWQQETNKIGIEIGHIADNDQVKHNSITITRAPPKITRLLVEEGYMLEIKEEGVRVVLAP